MTTVRPWPPFDPEPCVRVPLAGHIDERSAANTELPWGTRCCHLVAPPDITWSAGGIRVWALRLTGRPPIDLSDVPDQLRDAIELDVLLVLDWLSSAA